MIVLELIKPRQLFTCCVFFFFFLLCSSVAPPKELFCEMKEHKKIIEKGVPEDVPPGLKGRRVSKICMCRHTCNCMCLGHPMLKEACAHGLVAGS